MQYCLDLTAYACPVPLLTTKKAMQQLSAGDCLEIRLNKQSTVADFVLLAQEQQWQVVEKAEMTEQAVENRIIFRKK